MGLALSRKYRPPQFKDVSGQEHIKITLQNELEQDKIAHAYLFNGPRGTGKTTMARILSKAVNCLNRKEGESEPCNECESCKTINDGRSLDVVEIDAASNRGVENVQHNIIDYIRVRPTQHKYKVFIVDEVHMLTSYAFNALLKTLEEPPEYAIFILATTEVHKILPTIISRCQRFDFRKIESPVIKKRLLKLSDQEGIKIEDAVLDLVIHYSEGCMRDAESLLSQILTLDNKEIKLEQAQLVLPRSDIEESFKLLESIFTNKLDSALLLLNKLVSQGLDIDQFYKEFLALLRQLLMVKLNVIKIVNLDQDKIKDIQKLLEFVTVSQLMKVVNLFVMIPSQYKSAVIPQLSFEIAIVSSVNSLFADTMVNVVKQQGREEIKNKKEEIEEKKINSVEAQNFVSGDNNKEGNKEELENINNVDVEAQNIVSQNDVPIESNVAAISHSADPEELAPKEKVLTEITMVNTDDNASVIIDIKGLERSWGNVRTVLKRDNISLASLISVAAPRMESNKVMIVFRYKFNFDQVSKNPDLQDLLQNAIQEVVGHSCQVGFICDSAVVLLEESMISSSSASRNEPKVESNADNTFFDILGVENVTS